MFFDCQIVTTFFYLPIWLLTGKSSKWGDALKHLCCGRDRFPLNHGNASDEVIGEIGVGSLSVHLGLVPTPALLLTQTDTQLPSPRARHKQWIQPFLPEAISSQFYTQFGVSKCKKCSLRRHERGAYDCTPAGRATPFCEGQTSPHQLRNEAELQNTLNVFPSMPCIRMSWMFTVWMWRASSVFWGQASLCESAVLCFSPVYYLNILRPSEFIHWMRWWHLWKARARTFLPMTPSSEKWTFFFRVWRAETLSCHRLEQTTSQLRTHKHLLSS